MPNTLPIINIKGYRIEAKGNSNGKIVFRDVSHFKAYHRRNNPIVRVEIRSTESSSTAGNQITSVSDVRKRPTQTNTGKARKRLTYDTLGEPVDDDTIATNHS